MMRFGDRLAIRVAAVGSPTCVGLDPHLNRLPLDAAGGRAQGARAAELFCRGVIDSVAEHVACVKPQVAFFEALGSPGVAALEAVVSHARAAGLIVVLDAKRGDIGSTAEAYARATLDDDGPMGADAVTLSPYLGAESLAPFARRTAHGKGLFVLVRTSNPGSGVWQGGPDAGVARGVAEWITAQNADADDLGPIGAVIGGTLGDEVAAWRAAMPKAWFLVPGFGAQGAGPDDVRRQFRGDGRGAIITSSRGVLFPATGTDGSAWRTKVNDRARALVDAVSAITR
ncbi:MAG: orotidine-5'-phosphate decarboxylase [Myxococcota bacterium]|jgi:orotidine-5'-phosphate decarboxylase